jgi:hypothetical protein
VVVKYLFEEHVKACFLLLQVEMCVTGTVLSNMVASKLVLWRIATEKEDG